LKRYIVHRLIISVVTIWVLATVSFFLLRVLPGNPFQTPEGVDEAMMARIYRYYGMDRPLIVQYLTYMANLLRGDMGYSMKYTNLTVNGIIASAFPVSAQLGIISLSVAIPIGLFLGVLSARKRGQAVDYMCVIIAVIGISIPGFIVGSLMQYVFGVKLRILPVSQWKTGISYKIMPVIAMSLGMIASLTRNMRASMLEVTTQDYIKTAQAKGLPAWRIVWSHQIRNSLVPIVTMLGPMVASVLMGTFVIEKIFALPGLGRHFVDSITSLDYTLTLGLTIFFGSFFVAANFLVDLAYGLIDPRIRVSK
jgi:oligopeptide transport system permease protein